MGRGLRQASRRTATQTGSQVRKGDRACGLSHPPMREKGRRRSALNRTEAEFRRRFPDWQEYLKSVRADPPFGTRGKHYDTTHL